MNVFFNKKSSHATQCEETTEVDGFVLIGTTSDEKNTVRPGDAINKEKPPGYDDLNFPNLSEGRSSLEQLQSHRSPVTKTYCDEDISAQPSPYANAQTEVAQKPLATAIQDVPFKMAPSLTAAASNRHAHMISDSINKKVWKNLSEFEYNFDVEHHILNN